MSGQVSHKGSKYTKKKYFVVSVALWEIRQFIINMTLEMEKMRTSYI
jgi:hypothetical protein